MPLYIEKINGNVDQPTNRPTNRQGEYRAICLFRKLENRKKGRDLQLEIEIEIELASSCTLVALNHLGRTYWKGKLKTTGGGMNKRGRGYKLVLGTCSNFTADRVPSTKWLYSINLQL